MLISLKRYPKMALFSKSAAKLLQQTAKTCQYLKKNAKKVHFFQGMVRYVNFFRKVVNLFRNQELEAGRLGELPPSI